LSRCFIHELLFGLFLHSSIIWPNKLTDKQHVPKQEMKWNAFYLHGNINSLSVMQLISGREELE
jgi:hypothetical protein